MINVPNKCSISWVNIIALNPTATKPAGCKSSLTTSSRNLAVLNFLSGKLKLAISASVKLGEI